ncbi:hypothetical protein FDP41_007554 [Naegleria fowleri]|uniref:PAS domain-containing protein n=1 Tax=Naegleria fowleri TaxID=5763 RepID=A0A6A5C500_NAEFO|nr:uncharacterized protein FDP41_007554 [Naegleria fowleri]KAF0984377.1 hypothetical protein FDP41_007554 [Naegleria fowleri]
MSSTQGTDDADHHQGNAAITSLISSNNAPPNNRFIPFYMRDDLPQNRQSKSKVNQRRRRKTIQDVLQQKSSSLSTSSNHPLHHTNSATSHSTASSSSTTPTNILPRQHQQQQTTITPIQPPHPSQGQTHSSPPILQHLPTTRHQGIYPPSLRARYPSVLQSYPHYVQLPTNPLPFPPSPYQIHQQQQKEQKYETTARVKFSTMVDTSRSGGGGSSTISSSTPPQGLPTQSLSEISNKFGGLSEQYRNSALQRSASSSSLLSKNVLTNHPHQPPHEHQNSEESISIKKNRQEPRDSEQINEKVVVGSTTTQPQQEPTPSSIASFLSSNGSKLQQSSQPQRSNIPNTTTTATAATITTTTTTTTNNSLLVPTSSSVSSSSSSSSTTNNGKVGTASASSSTAIHKLKRLQQQIRSSDKDLHAINSSAQVLNYLKMVQQQQQAYIQQRLLLQSSSIPNLNVSVNHIKDQLYSNINNANSSNSSSNNNGDNGTDRSSRSSSYLPSTFIPSYQLDPTVDMMISNWENQIRQTKQRQRMQQLYRRPIPNLRLPPHQDHSQYMIDSSSSESSSGMGSHSDRSEAWMSARFGASTLSSSSRVSTRSMGLSPLNSPSSSCSMMSDCTATANANTSFHDNSDFLMISPHHQQQAQLSARSTSNNSRLTAEQLSPEDEDEDGDTLMIDDSSPTLDHNKDSSSNNNKILPSISKLNLPINLPPLNLLSLSNSNSISNLTDTTSCNNNMLSVQASSTSDMEGVKSCPTTPQHSARATLQENSTSPSSGIQQLFVNPFSSTTSGSNTTFNFSASQPTTLATTSVQPNSISLNNNNTTLLPSHQQHTSVNNSHSSSYIPEGFITQRTYQQHHFSRNTKQIHHQIHSSQNMSSRTRDNHLVNAESVINSNNNSICPSPKRPNQYHHYSHLTSPRSSKKKKLQESSEAANISDPSDVLGIDFIPDDSSNSVQPNEDIQQRMSMQLFQAIFRHTPLPMFILNSKGKFMSVNHAFISMLDYESEACFNGKNALEFVYSETDSISLMTQIQKSAIEGGMNNHSASTTNSSLVSPQQHFKMNLKDSNGSHVQAENTIYVLRDVMYGSGEFFVFTVTSYQSSSI